MLIDLDPAVDLPSATDSVPAAAAAAEPVTAAGAPTPSAPTSSDLCAAVLGLPLAAICADDGAACGCSVSESGGDHQAATLASGSDSHSGASRPGGSSRYCVLLSGGLRSFAASSFSLRAFILDVNAPIDVFVYGSYDAGVPQDEENLELLRGVATAFVLEPFRFIPTRMIWQWSAIRNALEMATAYADARGRPYDAIVRARPDTVYLTPLHLDTLLSRDREVELHRPYFRAHAWKSNAELNASADIPRPVLSTAPAFFPSFFVATPEVMQLMIAHDFYQRFWRVRNDHLNSMLELKPLGLHADYWFAPGDGFESLLSEWLVWNQVPIAEIPHVGPSAFVWGTLRPQCIGDYCDGTWMSCGQWTDVECVIEHGLREGEPDNRRYNMTEIVRGVPEARQYCAAWQEGEYPPVNRVR
ncbi:hypothetical protein JKP88DRAFT_351704 [Tribonema minus]|uniref:Uncharacterized protein n=1 Tax=Tribonema minus TaxID=303371 RepID=A0A835YGX0_9STRA|nr:hypothetical protein JKP88DRAFT_351704 [Tribonema minus]